MDFYEYQDLSKGTAIYPAIGSPLAGQMLVSIISVGRLVGIIKKLFRDEGGTVSLHKETVIKSWIREIELDVSQISTPPKSFGFPPAASIYPVLGLVDEAAELAEKVFQRCYSKVEDEKNETLWGIMQAAQGIQITDDDLKKEVGDVLWYLAQICTELGLSLDEAAHANLEKLFDRQSRGVLGGSGDKR